MTHENEYIVFGAPLIEEEDIAEVVDSLRSGWIGTGPKVAAFEDAFRDYKGAEYAVAVNSCTASLHLSLLVAGVGPGDEVITTPLTFGATVNAVIHSGATPVLAEVDALTMNIDPLEVERKITSKTRALLVVHFAGRPCNMGALCAIADRHGLILVEDCAHAIETEYRGQKAGTFGDFGCFSFYVTKNLITGEGGMVVCRRDRHAARIKMLALHGMTKDAWKRFSDDGYKYYTVEDCGYKYNMMDLQAAIGLGQLRRVEASWRRRQEVWRTYNEAFAALPVRIPTDPESDTRHAYHLYTLLIDEEKGGINRDRFLMEMHERAIGTGVHYLSIPEHGYYRERFSWRTEDFPNAMRIGRSTVSIPLSPRLSDDDVGRVVEAVQDILA